MGGAAAGRPPAGGRGPGAADALTAAVSADHAGRGLVWVPPAPVTVKAQVASVAKGAVGAAGAAITAVHDRLVGGADSDSDVE